MDDLGETNPGTTARLNGESGPGKLPFPELPEDLEYLLAPALKYGRSCHTDEQSQAFLEAVSEYDFEALAALAERVRLQRHYDRILQWLHEVDSAIESAVSQRFPSQITTRRSGIAEQRQELRERLNSESNEQIHHMDVYFLFGIIDACDLEFE